MARREGGDNCAIVAALGARFVGDRIFRECKNSI
jgi:hypothetical protein